MARRDTGKTPAGTILARMGCLYSLPVIPFIILFAIVAAPVVPFIILGYFGAIIIYTFLQWFFVNRYFDAVNRNDPYCRAWREGGGDYFLDCQGWPFNNDSAATSVAAPTGDQHYDYPPHASCPHYGGPWDSWEGCQCSKCLIFWSPYYQEYGFYDLRTNQYLLNSEAVLDEPDEPGPDTHLPTRKPI